MTTGPEHYKRAEQLLADIRKAQASMGAASPPGVIASAMAEAQVHATLALAAATAIAPGASDEVSPDWYAWFSAAGTQSKKPDA